MTPTQYNYCPTYPGGVAKATAAACGSVVRARCGACAMSPVRAQKCAISTACTALSTTLPSTPGDVSVCRWRCWRTHAARARCAISTSSRRSAAASRASISCRASAAISAGATVWVRQRCDRCVCSFLRVQTAALVIATPLRRAMRRAALCLRRPCPRSRNAAARCVIRVRWCDLARVMRATRRRATTPSASCASLPWRCVWRAVRACVMARAQSGTCPATSGPGARCDMAGTCFFAGQGGSCTIDDSARACMCLGAARELRAAHRLPVRALLAAAWPGDWFLLQLGVQC
jgi:hypothetical protein